MKVSAGTADPRTHTITRNPRCGVPARLSEEVEYHGRSNRKRYSGFLMAYTFVFTLDLRGQTRNSP